MGPSTHSPLSVTRLIVRSPISWGLHTRPLSTHARTLWLAFRSCRKLNSAVLTDENTELLRQSVQTLTKTLQHVEVR